MNYQDLEQYAKRSQLSLYNFGRIYRARTELQGEDEFIKINKSDYLKLMKILNEPTSN